VLAFLEAKWSIHLRAEHVRGVENEVADALSRNKMDVVVYAHRWCRSQKRWARKSCK